MDLEKLAERFTNVMLIAFIACLFVVVAAFAVIIAVTAFKMLWGLL